MASSSSTTASNKSTVVERPSQEPLKCPRCDSSNTKFCYYNNYSLSQPRHFCKACKRYWTRGGTLRNVPVGGGCRKNNRVRRPPSSNASGEVISTAATAAGNPSFLQPRVDLSRSLLYNLSTADTMNPLEFSFPFSGLITATKVSSDDHSSELFDIQPRVTDLGIGFSSSSGLVVEDDGGLHNNNMEFRNGFSSSSSSSSIFNNPSLFGSSSSAFNSSTSTTISSLLASTIQQQKYANSGGLKDIETRTNNLQDLMPYHEGKSTQQNGSGWSPNPNPISNLYHISQINPSDPNSPLLSWFDPSNNMGSSVPSLI